MDMMKKVRNEGITKWQVLGPFAIMSNTDYRFVIEKEFNVKQGYYSIPYPKIIKRDGLYYNRDCAKLFGKKIDNTNIEYNFDKEDNTIIFSTKDFLVDYKTTGWVWFELERSNKGGIMELTKDDFIELVSYAHIEGQSDAGIAASWSNARAYAEGRWNKLNPDLTNKDVALKIAMDYIGATEAIKIETNSDDNKFDVYGTNKGPLPGEVSPRIILLYHNKDNGDYESFYIGKSFSNWKEGKPFESKYEYEEVYFKDIIKGVKEQ